jgi:hypothetical protein
MRIAGIVFDFYDDQNGLVLRNKIASTGAKLPEKLASMEALSPEDIELLPDRLFALVGVAGGEPVRKFAMHDPEHLALSMIYFDETAKLLPEAVRSKVASNLILGCSWYDIDPPDSLVKVAISAGTALAGAAVAGLGVMDMASKAREGKAVGRERMDAFRQAQASGMKTASGREIELSLDQDQDLQHDRGPESGHIWSAFDLFSQPGPTHKKLDAQIAKRDQLEPQLGKVADLVGTEAMPVSTLRAGSGRPSPGKRLNLPMKTSAARIAAETLDGDWQPCGELKFETPRTTKRASYENYAMPHLRKYPIDTETQLKTASDYFDEYCSAFSFPDRRVFAHSVWERAAELGVKVAGKVLDYAGEGYGPHITSELQSRVDRFEGTGHETVYGMLQEKVSEINPAVMAEMLREADAVTKAASSYGRVGVGFMDPYAAVFGSAKLANEPAEEDTYSWSEGNDYVAGMHLVALSKRALNLDSMFGKGFAASFQKDPIGIFKSMPSPQKVVLSRLAADNGSSNTFRI